MRVNEFMSTKVVTVEPSEKASVAWEQMRQHRIHHLVVMENRRVAGILSDRDLGGRSGAPTRRGQTVGDLMTREVMTVSPDATIRHAANSMRGRSIGCLPVMEEDRIVGIITTTDVLTELGRGKTRPGRRPKQRPTRRSKSPSVGESLGRQSETVTDRTSLSGRNNPKLGRNRKRKPDSPQRSPLASWIPRPAKAVSGRTAAAEVPANIRSFSVNVDHEDLAYLRRKLGMKLGKFAHSIERVSIRMKDVNGPKGGKDKVCRIKVVLSGLPSVMVEENHVSLQAVMDGALARAEKAVKRVLQRRQATRGQRVVALPEKLTAIEG